MTNSAFDPRAKEAALRAESESWDTAAPADAEPGDIPVIDVGDYLSSGSSAAREAVATELAHACETVGFWQLVGHDIDDSLIDDTFDAVRTFHALPLETKEQIRMDRPEWPLGGVGYLPMHNRKLPARATGNVNEAFLVKSDRAISMDDNQWPDDAVLPGFRDTVTRYGQAVESLALRLLPLYATALGVDPDWFAPGFTHPFWRLRLTHYPAQQTHAGHAEKQSGNRSGGSEPAASDQENSAGSRPEVPRSYGINPHVDTTFFTLLLQDSPGLTIHHAPTDRWLRAPLIERAFVVNTGELLKMWTNDRYVSVRHYADAIGDESRYSIPFFFNANADYPMQCVPTCHGPGQPPKYPPISYAESQAAAQGE